MEELRSIQKDKIRNATKIGELKERLRQINKTNEDIEKIKENQPVVIDENVLETSLKGRAARFLKKYKIPILSTAVQGILGLAGSIATTLGIADYFHKGTKKIGQLAGMIEKTAKTMKIMAKTMDNITKYPVETFAAILKMMGYLVKEISLNPVVLASLVSVLTLVHIIKRWRGE